MITKRDSNEDDWARRWRLGDADRFQTAAEWMRDALAAEARERKLLAQVDELEWDLGTTESERQSVLVKLHVAQERIKKLEGKGE